MQKYNKLKIQIKRKKMKEENNLDFLKVISFYEVQNSRKIFKNSGSLSDSVGKK